MECLDLDPSKIPFATHDTHPRVMLFQVAITDWRKLSRLMLNNNNLKGVPATLMHCSALRELTLGANALTMLPVRSHYLTLNHTAADGNGVVHCVRWAAAYTYSPLNTLLLPLNTTAALEHCCCPLLLPLNTAGGCRRSSVCSN